MTMTTQVAIIFAELDLPYTTEAIWDPTDLKKAPFTNDNPNGRAPGKILSLTSHPPHSPFRCAFAPIRANNYNYIHTHSLMTGTTTLAVKDPDTGVTLWESCAIIKYLMNEYDKEGKPSFNTAPEKYLSDQ